MVGSVDKEKVLGQLEEMRQGFASVLTCDKLPFITRISVESYHEYANTLCVGLGGESVETVRVRLKPSDNARPTEKGS